MDRVKARQNQGSSPKATLYGLENNRLVARSGHFLGKNPTASLVAFWAKNIGKPYSIRERGYWWNEGNKCTIAKRIAPR